MNSKMKFAALTAAEVIATAGAGRLRRRWRATDALSTAQSTDLGSSAQSTTLGSSAPDMQTQVCVPARARTSR